MTVLQEPVQAAIWQALNHYKGNKSYLVECFISRKAMMILLLSLVIELAFPFHCWYMYIARQIGLPKDQNVTKRALV
uniref:Uncharacterized protein n=1 Tax=Pan troglodytes TaxID=9598 RepID=A0A2I3TW25_PANTR